MEIPSKHVVSLSPEVAKNLSQTERGDVLKGGLSFYLILSFADVHESLGNFTYLLSLCVDFAQTRTRQSFSAPSIHPRSTSLSFVSDVSAVHSKCHVSSTAYLSRVLTPTMWMGGRVSDRVSKYANNSEYYYKLFPA